MLYMGFTELNRLIRQSSNPLNKSLLHPSFHAQFIIMSQNTLSCYINISVPYENQDTQTPKYQKYVCFELEFFLVEGEKFFLSANIFFHLFPIRRECMSLILCRRSQRLKPLLFRQPITQRLEG